MWVWLCIFLQHFSLYHIRTHQSHFIMSQQITFWLAIILNQQIQCHVPHSETSVKLMPPKEMSQFPLNERDGLRTVSVAPLRSTKISIPLCESPINVIGSNLCPKKNLQIGSKTIWQCRLPSLHTHTSVKNRPPPTWQAHECLVHQTRLRYVHHCWCVKHFKWYLEAASFSCLCQGSNPVARVIASVQEFVFSRTSLCEKVELQDKSFHTTSCCQAAD